jgi:uncharacterized FlaG/YvyC family protein
LVKPGGWPHWPAPRFAEFSPYATNQSTQFNEILQGVTVMLTTAKMSAIEQPAPAYLGSKTDTNAVQQSHDIDNHGKVIEPEKKASDAEVSKAVDTLNEHLSRQSRQVQFKYDGDSRQLVAILVDTATNEVLSQVPSAEILRMAKAIRSGSQAIISIHA